MSFRSLLNEKCIVGWYGFTGLFGTSYAGSNLKEICLNMSTKHSTLNLTALHFTLFSVYNMKFERCLYWLDEAAGTSLKITISFSQVHTVKQLEVFTQVFIYLPSAG
jgi:hypothetical protein